MGIDVGLLAEPKLQFSDYFEHEDTKTGLAEFGPFGRNVPGLHPAAVKLGYIGTRESVEGAQEWIEKCGHGIESENVETVQTDEVALGELFTHDAPEQVTTFRRLKKILNRDFVGFNTESSFKSSFQNNPRWVKYIDPRTMKPILELPKKSERIKETATLINAELASITETDPAPDIVIIALTSDIEDLADSVRISGNFFLNLRRVLKANAMGHKRPIPIQLIRRHTAEGKGHIQEVATRAWNFCTAQYYKAQGIPWRPLSLEENTCYVGISFYVAQDIDSTLTMRSSVAQAFDFLGQGLVLRGDQFEWDADSLGPTPHLTKGGARRLISNVIDEYMKLRNVPPNRLVIHKTSEFWGKERGDYDEEEGFYEGIYEHNKSCEVDLVALRQSNVRLFREGRYPPLRGTYFSVDGTRHFFYTMGFIPYLETYPKTYVPEPWEITQHIGGSSPKDIFREILALTKMNVNNCAFADGTPITISFSQKVGEIMKHVGTDGKIQSQYRFYM